MVLTYFLHDGAALGKYYRAPSDAQVDKESIKKTLLVSDVEAEIIAKWIRVQKDTPAATSQAIYAASKDDALVLFNTWALQMAKMRAEAEAAAEGEFDEKGSGADQDAEFAAMTGSDMHFSTALSFAVKNRAINLDAVRAGFKLYAKWHYATAEGEGLIRNFMALGIAAVARRKEDFATGLLANLQALGDVPIVFAGAGGTFKAWLYLGYDILAHWSVIAKDTDYKAAPYMKSVIENVSRIIPKGDVRNSVDRDPGGNQKVVERNRALAAARQEFKDHWTTGLEEYYISMISGRKVISRDDPRKGTITAFVKGGNSGGNRS